MSREALNKEQFGDSHHWMHPVDKLHHWDNPDWGMGDEGWDPKELETSIREKGVQNPLEVVTSHHEPGKVFVVQGQHRLAAARAVGRTHVPVTDYAAHYGEWGNEDWDEVPKELR
jgi:hypothetical protein